MTEMRVFVSTDFTGHYPVGVSAVVFAENEDEARVALSNELAAHDLKFDGTLRELNARVPRAFVLQDGEY